MPRVVITGLGVLTALGHGAEATWRALLAGASAIGPIAGFDASSLTSGFGAEIHDFDPTALPVSRRSQRIMTRNDQLAVAGAQLALQDAGIDVEDPDAARAGLFVGSNKEIADPANVEDAVLGARNDDGSADMGRLAAAASSVHPLFYVEGLQCSSLFYLSQAFGLKGANAYFAGTADSGLTAIARAFRAVRRGEVPWALAGGFDDAVSWWNLSKLDAFGVLAGRSGASDPTFQPYDRARQGSLLGEGAAFVVVEDRARALRRGARPYAEVIGSGGGQDFAGVGCQPDGEGLVIALSAALRGSTPSRVGYVATHGCATRRGDPSEAASLRRTFGAGAATLAASSVKPATGHLVGGAGALNAAVAALAVATGAIPPTLNLEHVDPDCAGIDWVRGEAREERIGQALALARGLEGQNVVLSVAAA